MLSIKGPLTSAHLGSYLKNELGAASSGYYSESGSVQGKYHGQLVSEFGLEGKAVEEYDFLALANGQSPVDGAQLVEHRKPVPVKQPDWVTNDAKWREKLQELFIAGQPFRGADGYKASDAMHWMLERVEPTAPGLRWEVVREMCAEMGLPAPDPIEQPAKRLEHRAGWDLTFSAPKSISVTAVEDERIRGAHRAAVQAALNYAESRTQAHLLKGPETTGKWIAATFEHDTSRPDKGYAAPQIHTHVIVFNLTKTADGTAHALEPKEFFGMQDTLTWVYRTKLRDELHRLGYELEPTENGFEIKGYSREYLESESPRRQSILRRLEELGLSSPRAAEIIAHQDREEKLQLSRKETLAMHRAHAEEWGNPAQAVVAGARERGPIVTPFGDSREAVTFAVHHLGDRLSVMRHDKVVMHALRYGWRGGVTVGGVQQDIGRRVEEKELVEVKHTHRQSAAPRYAAEKQRQREREVIQAAVQGRETMEPIVENADLSRYEKLQDNPRRQKVIQGILGTRDQTVILQGGAGTGKTSSMRIIAEIAQQHGLEVRGVAPTGKAADTLREFGISAETLQRELLGQAPGELDKPRFYFVDEGSLASTKQMHQFYQRVRPQDRVLLIGDDSPKRKVGQHTSVEAGRMFHELQEAGAKTAFLNKILRQQETPWLRDVVRHFRNGQTAKALAELDGRGKILDYFATPAGRYAHIAHEYAKNPYRTLVVSPDNKSRSAINSAIRAALRERGWLGPERQAYVLVNRDAGSQANLRLASTYRTLDRVRYLRGSREIGLAAGEYATVVDVDRAGNRITVLTRDKRSVTYDPKQLAKVALYEEREIGLAVGDRVQFTAPFRQKAIRTRETGTVKELDGQEITVALENGKEARWSLGDFRHIDHGYVGTSHSVQSATCGQEILHVDTSDTRLRSLHNQVFAYVAGSRPEHDLIIVTDDKQALMRELGRSVERETALSREEIQAAAS